MKKLFFVGVVLLSNLCSAAQNIEGLYSFFDYPISTIDIQTDYSQIHTFVRKVDVGDKTQYYYVLKTVSKDIHTSILFQSVILISNEDLEKINNALKVLLAEEDRLWDSGIAEIDYVENKYVTENGIGIGFCVDKGRLEWFIDSDYHGAINGWNLKERVIDNKAFSINNGKELESSFVKAQTKIESLIEIGNTK